MHSNQYDAIILGAGGAGLLLLDAMHRDGWLENHRVLVIEPQEKKSNDRTWCFWSDGTDPVLNHEDIVSHQWSYANNGLGRKDALHPYRYFQIRGLDFYSKLVPELSNHQNVDWLNEKAVGVCETEEFASVQIGQSEFRSSLVFDSRPFSKSEAAEIFTHSEWMWQSFVGYRIKLRKTSFQEDTCTLMDFNIPQNGETQFIYTLPTSPTEGLVELTRFGKSCLSENAHSGILTQYIKENFGDYEIVEKEVARIPMTTALNADTPYHPVSKKVIPIGTRAGAVKGTTGYAFKKMASHAEEIVSALRDKTQIPTPYHKKRLVFYDNLLLKVLSDHTDSGKKIFQSLFRKRRSAEVLRFLDEETSVFQESKILSTLPPLPFLEALFSKRKSKLSLFRRNQSLGTELSLAVIALILIILNFLTPQVVENISPWILVAGLVFPGIPHGAADHWVTLGKKFSLRKLIDFAGKYILFMLLITMVWWINSALGLSLFIIYSAWHFGETDMREWGSYSPFNSWLWGASVLGTLLLGHLSELVYFFEIYNAESILTLLFPFRDILLGLLIGGMILTGFLVKEDKRLTWSLTSFVVLAGLALPLLAAFALYFIGFHSFRGWRHLENKLDAKPNQLVKMALPFTLGAWVTAVVLYLSADFIAYPLEDLLAFGFVWIAALSAPHIIVMHRMYSARH